MRVLLLATTTGYQTRAFGEAAERLGVDLVFATDRCDMLEDPWQDRALPIRFYDEAASVAAILAAAREAPIDAVVAVGDRPTVIAAMVREALGLPGHPPAAAAAARNKRVARERFKAAGLPTPRFVEGTSTSEASHFAPLGFPMVIKPVALSGSRGVMRVDNDAELSDGLARVRSLMSSPDIRAERNDAHGSVLAEQFIEGREFALEGIMNQGILDVLAIFDKPDPLDGPLFEETIYVTPSNAPPTTQSAIVRAIATASRALGLSHGPIHAECRVNSRGVFVLEVAGRPIGGLCARALRFARQGAAAEPHALVRGNLIPISAIGHEISFEELLIRHALGEESNAWRREWCASGVMMIPIPRRGILRGVTGIDEARVVPAIEDVRITAKPDQLLIPLPEGASYLGFIFARADRALDVDIALRTAHARLNFNIAPEVRVLQSIHG
jgi:ATP-grasp domain/L-amino acid ligase C-terminal domain 2/ATP-grasp N-terminal domain